MGFAESGIGIYVTRGDCEGPLLFPICFKKERQQIHGPDAQMLCP